MKYAFMINGAKEHFNEKEILKEIFTQLFENKKIDENDETTGTYQFEDFELCHVDLSFNDFTFVIKIVKENEEKNLYDLYADISYKNYWSEECDGEILDFFIEEIY